MSGEVADRVAGLEYGDDHLVQPSVTEELTAGVRRLCRPARGPPLGVLLTLTVAARCAARR